MPGSDDRTRYDEERLVLLGMDDLIIITWARHLSTQIEGQ